MLGKNFESLKIQTEPFPHVVARDFLNADLCQEIMDGLPDLKDLQRGKKYGSNCRFNYSATNIAFNSKMPLVWKELVQYFLSQGFLDEVLKSFAPHIPLYFPDFEKRFGNLSGLKAGIRPVDYDTDADVYLDCQLAVNTPVSFSGTTVRAPHIDCPKKLFVGLLYLRLDSDDSSGGDLEFYVPSKPNILLDETRTADVSDMNLVKTIPYEKNTLVLLLNTPVSFHGVSVRSRTPHHRLFLNLLGEMSEPVFSLKTDGQSASLSQKSGNMPASRWTMLGY